MKLPWNFIETRDTPTPGFSPAQPCEVATEFGEHLARFADTEYAKSGRDARCLHCAFRKGTPPNQNPATLANAFKCVAEGEEIFYCHVNKGRPCEGYLMLARAKEEVADG
jgi:hypothetical protein